MSRVRRVADRFVVFVVGALVGGVAMVSIEGATRPAPPAGGPGPHSADVLPAPVGTGGGRVPGPDALLAWSPGGFPRRAARAVARLPGIKDVTMVEAGLDWITAERTDAGTRVRPPGGFWYPFEVAAINPAQYADFVPPGERAQILALRPGEALLSRTAARLRAGGEGLRIRLRDRTLVVAGVVSDDATGGYEALTKGPAPASWARTDEFLLMAARGADRARVARRLRRALDPGRGLVVRARGETPFLRYGDAVLPQALIKDAFGEFAARPRSDGTIAIDPRWVRRNIVTANLPLLGPVTCHRALMPQLRAALLEVRAANLGELIDPTDYGGCYSPRFINLDPTGRLSHHSWGIAFDINATESAYGSEPNLDPRIVDIVEGWGFTWGGRWLIPDGMHFEWRRFP